MKCYLIVSYIISSRLVSSRLVSSRLVSSRLASSRLVSSRLVSSRLVSSRLVSSRLVSSRLVSSRLVSSRLASPRFVSSRLVSSRLASPRLVSSRLVSSRLVSSRLVSSRPVYLAFGGCEALVAAVLRLSRRLRAPYDEADARVREGEPEQRREVLQRHHADAVGPPVVGRRPLLAAVQPGHAVEVGMRGEARLDGDGQRDGERKQPDEDDDEHGARRRETRLQRVEDRHVAVEADSDEREGVEEDGDDLHVADERAERRRERPVGEHVDDERQRHAQRRHQDVGARQVDDEVVGHRAHPLVRHDDVADDRVAAERQHTHGRVHRYGDRLQQRRHLAAVVLAGRVRHALVGDHR